VDCEPALDDQVQRVGRIELVEDDLAALERPPAGDAEDAPHVLAGHAVEQLPLHATESTPCVADLTLPPSRA